MEPIMTKKRTIAAKPVAEDTKARQRPHEVVASPKTKVGQLEAMLRRPQGATIGQIAKTLDWQTHSVRGAISGSLKKKQGLTIVAEKVADGDRIYRVVG